MKKLVICFSFLMILLSCNKDSTIDPAVKELNLITLNASVEASSLRSGPIDQNFTTNFPIGVYANKSGTWTAGSTNIINNDNAVVNGVLPHNVTFTGTYYYPIDGSTVNIFAFAPQGTESTAATAGSASTNAPQVTINMTGQEDIMWATASGTKTSVQPTLAFGHKLTQLQFTFVGTTGYPAGTTVTSLVLNAQPNSAVMNVQTGTCTFSGSAGMEAIQGTPVAITTSPGTNANSPIMTQAGNPISLTITVQPPVGPPVVYPPISVTGLTTVEGSAHMITITFSDTQITAKATVTAWATGSTGSAIVN